MYSNSIAKTNKLFREGDIVRALEGYSTLLKAESLVAKIALSNLEIAAKRKLIKLQQFHDLVISTLALPLTVDSLPKLLIDYWLSLKAEDLGSVSVIIPTWNRKDTVGNAINSVLRQRYQPLEILVCDDGSEDGTQQALETDYAEQLDTGLLKILATHHQGVCAARNRGLDAAKGEIIAYLDSDNIWRDDHLLVLCAALAINDKATSAYSAVTIFEPKKNNREHFQRFNRTALLRSNFIDLNAYVHKKDLINEYGKFDVALRRLVDWDLIIRFTQDQQPLAVPILTVVYYLDKNRLRNISRVEPLKVNSDIIQIKYAKEYQERKILTKDQINNARKRLEDADINVSAWRKGVAENSKLHIICETMEPFSDLGLIQALAVELHQVKSFSDGLELLDKLAVHDPNGIAWYPDSDCSLLLSEQLTQGALSLFLSSSDLVIVSDSLWSNWNIHVASIRNNTMLRCALAADFFRGRLLDSAIGKILSLPYKKNPNLGARNLEKIFYCNKEPNSDGLFDLGLSKASKSFSFNSKMDRNFPPLYLSGLQKPVVLVVAMKLAVGGVERNTIEIIRNLCDRYTFVYLTLEKTYPSAGSLASQVIDAGALLLDFAEILPKEAHLEALEWLQSTLNPDLVWVCNGSMWLCRYAKAFRAIFNNVPIIDQQVYDTEAGWIQHYNDEGIKDFDHHIAINSRIRDAFITQYGKSPSKISLIYPVFDPAKCIAANCISLNEKRDIRKELDLPEERKIFCFVGRLSEQKQPFRFLQLAKKRIGNNDEYFVMVGDGPLSNDVDRWLEDNNLTNFCRMKYIEDVPRFYSIVDGLVIVSRYEGLPIAMLEALAVGVPVLSTDVGDVKLVLEEYGSGRIFDCNLENTSSVFGSEFEQFKCRLNNYSSKALESRNIVLQRFSAKTVASKYENCFKVALSQFRK